MSTCVYFIYMLGFDEAVVHLLDQVRVCMCICCGGKIVMFLGRH